ncbi:MAG: terminase family protein [Myxococcales bacterium]|jgi:phage FluMu gp28-like protein|nr:terminase family protein [Myxococcales bacterium]
MPTPAIPLYGYQKRWLKDRSRWKVGMFSRQSGKSFVCTLEIALDCLKAEAAGRPTKWVILSRGERQAKEAMLEGVHKHLKAYQVAFDFLEDVEHELEGEDGITKRVKAQEVVFSGGSRIIALPATPDTARGFSANVFLDEFAFHKDSAKIWRAVFPIVSRGWRLLVVSTPNGKGNKFYELVTGKSDSWSRHICDIHQAIAEGLPYDAEELRLALCDEDAWRQEYLLEWLDEASNWLPFELIDSVEDESAGVPEKFSGGTCFIGNDIARHSHLWVAWVVELVGDVLWTREIETLKGASFAEQDATLDALIARYNPVRVCMDQTGIGEKPVEDAQRRYGSRIEGVKFTPGSKQTMADLAKRAFQDRKIRIPQGDNVLRRDLHKLKCVPSPVGGTPRFIADSDASGHADRFWSMALAVSAASTPHIDLGSLKMLEQPRVELDGFDGGGGRVSLEGF